MLTNRRAVRPHRLRRNLAGRQERSAWIGGRIAGGSIGSPCARRAAPCAGTPARGACVLAPVGIPVADPPRSSPRRTCAPPIPTIAADIYAGFFAFAGRAPSPPAAARPSTSRRRAGPGARRSTASAGCGICAPPAPRSPRPMPAPSSTSSSRRAHGDRRIAPRDAGRRAAADLVHQPIAAHPRRRRPRLLSALPAHHRPSRARSRAGRCAPSALPQRRLMAAIAPCYAGLCCEGLDGTLRRATRLLVPRARPADPRRWRPCEPQSARPDRSPVRSPAACARCSPAGKSTRPEALLHAIDRMLPMVRLFRHGDGTLSHFNGMGVTAADHLATLLTYDDMRSQPIHHAPLFRLRAPGGGPLPPRRRCRRVPPPTAFVGRGRRASCLSFEFSSGRSASSSIAARRASPTDAVLAGGPLDARRIPPPPSTTSRRACFVAPPGHGGSTRFLAALAPDAARAGCARRRPRRVSRRSAASATTSRALNASHDGYRAALRPHASSAAGGSRRTANGSRARTCSRPTATPRPQRGGDPLPPRPGHQGEPRAGRRAVMLVLPNREAWQFEASPADACARGQHLLLCHPDGARRTEQIVLRAASARDAARARGASSGFEQRAPASATQRRPSLRPNCSKTSSPRHCRSRLGSVGDLIVLSRPHPTPWSGRMPSDLEAHHARPPLRVRQDRPRRFRRGARRARHRTRLDRRHPQGARGGGPRRFAT